MHALSEAAWLTKDAQVTTSTLKFLFWKKTEGEEHMSPRVHPGAGVLLSALRGTELAEAACYLKTASSMIVGVNPEQKGTSEAWVMGHCCLPAQTLTFPQQQPCMHPHKHTHRKPLFSTLTVFYHHLPFEHAVSPPVSLCLTEAALS